MYKKGVIVDSLLQKRLKSLLKGMSAMEGKEV